MNTSSATPSGRSPLRPVRAASVTALAAVALTATVGLGIAHASSSATAASDGVSVSASGHGYGPAGLDPEYTGLPTPEEWRHSHHGH
ncbi:hypothetical protein BFL36_01725 [Clavibacter michiganensis]|uniref:Uncharacterized protein n=1 Tax=Clavibacter michiganensis TaxID=28447 RepID=A0A251YVP3_9MICO|nr:hypothetical protein [Clavibacter michiganensis]OUE28326.1 hypothetical protein BFL36_01725 [Clavibacter michiganensis]